MQPDPDIYPKDIIDSKEESLLIKNNQNASSLPQTPYQYKIMEYDEQCEDFSKISEITCLAYSPIKLTFFIFLNIITCFIITLFVVWFYSIKLKLLYTRVTLDQAQFLGILGTDGKFIVIPIEHLQLPNITDSFIKTQFKNNLSSHNVIYFTYKLFKYVYDEHKQQFTAFTYELKSTNEIIHSRGIKGLNKEEIEYQYKIYGECDLQIQIKSFFMLLMVELTDPFYMFQLFSIILWMNNNYYAYAVLIIIATVVSLVISCWETRENLENLQQMAKYSCDVNVYRIEANGERVKETISSTDLVPGDVIEIPGESFAMPCDCILLNGTVIVNEAMLTGESTPIIKAHLPNLANTDYSSKINTKHLIYAGTKIIQKRSINELKVIGIVYSTGFNTTKGNLIRSILFPKEIDFQFKTDSIKYIIFMAIVSVLGFAISLPFLLKAGLHTAEIIKRSLDLITTTVPPALPACLGIGISYALGRLKRYGIMCINRERVNIAGKINMICFDKTGTLTEDHLDIYGFRPVINDKDSFGFGPFIKEASSYEKEAYEYYKAKRQTEGYKDRNKDLKEMFIECLATCHSCTKVNGKLIGDPIDVQMFEASGWQLYESNENDTNYDALISTFVRPPNEKDLKEKMADLSEDDDESLIIEQHYELGIIRRIEFSSQLQRMSVIVKDVNDPFTKIFCKGSPEQIKKLCRPDTIPSNFNEQLSKYTMKGLRVLALATKMMKMTYVQSQEITRQYAESNMIFLGLLIVQNSLKEATTPSIQGLTKANLRMVMATGDNILTAIAVSKECALIKKEAVVYSCEVVKEGKESQLIWNTIENFNETEYDENKTVKYPLIKNNNGGIDRDDEEEMTTILMKSPKKSLIEHFPPEQFTKKNNQRKASEELFANALQSKKDNHFILGGNNDDNISEDSVGLNIDTTKYLPYEDELNNDYIIAITGKTFEILSNLKEKYYRTEKVKYEIYATIYNIVLKHCFIYARMAPEHKTMLVEALKAEQYTVMMCGDGANDCGALRAADVGVSLSTEEASIAAHFTSRIPDISCLIKLLREGKASLVTSIQTFKYMMIYSIIQFMSVTMLMVVNSYLSDYQFLATDVFIIFPLAFFFAQTGAYKRLTPHKPTDSLISVPIISSIMIQSFIAFVFQYSAWSLLAYTMPWYENKCSTTEMITEPCYDNTAIYLISNMQYFITAFSFSISKPFRKPIYSNILLTLFMLFAFIYSTWLIVYPNELTFKILLIETFVSSEFKFLLLGLSIINFIVSYITEKALIPFIVLQWKRYQYSVNTNSRKVHPGSFGQYISIKSEDD